MKTAMIFAAGLGTRLKPLTETMPKALVEINNKTLLQIAIEKLLEAGFQKIVINTHHFAKQIISFLNNNRFDAEILISNEKDELLDTGGGIYFARKKLGNQPFLVHNVDIVSNADLANIYNLHQPESIATLLVSDRQSSRYLLFDQNNRLVGWQNNRTKEIKSPYNLTNTCGLNRLAFNGIHVISPDVFELMKNLPKKNSIIDFYISICSKKTILAHQQDCLRVTDVGTLEKLQLAKTEYFDI